MRSCFLELFEQWNSERLARNMDDAIGIRTVVFYTFLFFDAYAAARHFRH